MDSKADAKFPRLRTSFRRLRLRLPRYLPGQMCLVLLLAIMASCADLNWQKPAGEKEVKTTRLDVPLPEADQAMAMDAENDEQYLEALDYWKSASQVITGRIAFLYEQLKTVSEAHAQQGIDYYEEKKGSDAFREFIAALRLYPFNREALDYLLNRYEAGRFILYTVKEKDSFEVIAKTVYGSPSYEFLIKHFSNVKSEKNLVPGEMITLPVLNSFFSQALIDYKKDIQIARKLFKDKAYKELLPLAETILEDHPGDSEASYILNMSLLKIADNQRNGEEYEQAIHTLSRVDPAFKNVKESIREIEQLKLEKQERDSQLANAELFQQGQKLYAQGRYLEALDAFSQVDPGYQNIEGVIADVREKLANQAELHFKEGVKYFVEEDLKQAIAEWKQALTYDPGHVNARNSIEKARKLLDKVKQIDQ